MRKVLRVTAMAAIGLAMLSCARRAEQEVAPPPPVAYQSDAPDGGASYGEREGQALAAPYGRTDYPGAGTRPPPPYDRSTYDAAEEAPPAYDQPSYAPPRPSPSFYARPSYVRPTPPSYALSPQVIRPPVYAPPSYNRPAYAEAAPPPPGGSRMVWQSSPRWATVKRTPSARLKPASQKSSASQARAKPKPDPQAKFKAAQAKAAKVGVENLTQEDIAGLTADEIRQLRGY